MEHAVYATKTEPQPLAVFGHQTWAEEWRDKYCATGEVRPVPLFEAIQAAREYYSASQTVVEEIGTDNTTKDDFYRQSVAADDLRDALEAFATSSQG